MGWKKKMQKAKKLHRPSLKDWEQDGLHGHFPAFVKSLSAPQEQYRSLLLLSDAAGPFSAGSAPWPRSSSNRKASGSPHEERGDGGQPPAPRNVPVILDARTLTRDEFAASYEAKEIPVVIRGIPDGHDGGGGTAGPDHLDSSAPWRAKRRWRLEALMHHRRDEEEEGDARRGEGGGDRGRGRRLLNRKFKCGEDDDGRSIKVKLKHFLAYLRANRDDSPLYVFDSGFDDDAVARALLDDYRVPSYFGDDLFRLVSESRRPPYRWFLVGPERSGTCVHVDPLATNAWNTLIEGRKRWVLFPPHVPKCVAKGRGLVGDDEDDEAIHYFMYILPRIKKRAIALKDRDPKYRDFACYEFTQHPGETVFVPNGWWHAVLNLSDTVGVTQNFCSPRNFDKVWVKTRSGRKRMAWKWLLALDSHRPDLARRARELNERDGFRMKYDPAEIDRRRRQESKNST